ncbi:hypothetical protein KIW84_035998 [Lathyrus oleraceus]|uniref:Uncharacterized protein n=1 Tax=Pisum sativum TaxID=3888 RepID=A0A9D4Y337_PEA|nr:hypothetical protein KIW84_035998 [Pisum sativum]
MPFQFSSKLSKRDTFSDNDKRCRANSTLSVQTITRNLSRHLSKDKGAFQAVQSDGSRSRKGQPIVLDDDDSDDPHILEKTENKAPEYLKDAKIYFPSRDDPECVEVCNNDMECLASEGYLISTIMNFYIRYLKQQGASVRRNKRLRKSPDLVGCNDFDLTALVLSEQKIQRQLLKQSVGKRKISCLEDGDFDHPYALEEQRANLKQLYEASSSGITSQNSIHQQRPNMVSDSLGCVQMQTPSMHPDCNHTSDYTPLLPASIK